MKITLPRPAALSLSQRTTRPLSGAALAALLLALAAGGCTQADDLGTRQQAAVSFNAIAYNSITWNSITASGIADAGLDGGDLRGADLADPETSQVVAYLVQCALPADGEVAFEQDGTEYSFTGALGLAPEWAGGACGPDCQRWVSACLLARVNARGERVDISLRGPHPALRLTEGEAAAFPRKEGAYFGNLFAAGDQRWACSARADLALPRSCGDDTDGCYVDVVGTCADACSQSSPDWGELGCRTRDGATWRQAITVYLGSE